MRFNVKVDGLIQGANFDGISLSSALKIIIDSAISGSSVTISQAVEKLDNEKPVDTAP